MDATRRVSDYPPAPRPVTVSLERRLGPLDASAIVVSNVIGGGILFTPPQVAASVPQPILFLLVWLAGGALSFAGAMAYAELATLRPRAGGEYVYLRDGFGRLAGFLTGWTSFVAGFAGAIAVSAVVFAGYLGRFLPAAADTRPLFQVPLPWATLNFSPQSAVALAVIAGFSWIHARGIGPGRLVGDGLATLKVLALAVFVAAGFTFGRGAISHFSGGAPIAAAGWVGALIPVMFSYSGWNAASYVAEEIREPSRNVPRALALGTLAVVAIYLALNAVFLYVLTVSELAAVRTSVLDAVADRLLGASAGDVMAVVALVSLAASVSAMVLAGPRVYYAMARDSLFFKSAARVHPRHRTPAVAITAQAIWAGILVLSGTASGLVRYTGFAVVLFSGLAVAALFALRRREPAAARPYRAWGYPIAPAIFAAGSLLIVATAIWRDPQPSLAGLVIIGVGVPIYYLVGSRLPTVDW